MTKRAQIFDYLDYVAPCIPSPLYWLDTNIIVIGANESCLEAIGRVESLDVIVGKSFYEFHPKELAEELVATTKLVIETGKTIKVEECGIDFATGRERHFETIKSPLFDEDKVVVGVLCTAVEITDRKEKERLEFDNKEKQARLEERDKFKQVVDQVVHDIRSPIASMQMILPLCSKLPENLRVSLNKSAARILDIANNLLNKFKTEEVATDITSEIFQTPTLISAELLEIITEKKYEYSKLSIDFYTKISQVGYFAFLNIEMREFKRMISNLINNAVESFDSRDGEIIASLGVIDNNVQIVIQDNGNGIPADIKAKILENITVTSGKTKGHGIGFNQIRTTLSKSGGNLDIESEFGNGTKIILTFPKIDAPDWIAEKIELYNNDIVVILDDDDSIHGAWEARFKQAAPYIGRKHFEDGNETIAFINNLSATDKSRVFILTDYELLNQDLHGLDVVNQTGIKRSILVTSHHNDHKVRDLAKSTNTKILPKPLASEIFINILEDQSQCGSNNGMKKVDLICVDDDKQFVDIFSRVAATKNKIADKYYTVHEFLNNIHNYPKDTKILLDNQFNEENITGIELAKQLYNLGFSNLYLFSGHDFSGDSSIPHYLTPILKTDMGVIQQLLN